MRRAISLAAHGPADDANPQVGCVILDPNGAIVAEGWHEGAGTRHAEIVALEDLRERHGEMVDRLPELTAVVTLEPCNHTGRTGPCSEALIASGIGAIVYGGSDPGSASSGGAETLRAAGVRVEGGVLADEVRELLAPWLARVGSGRPHVTVKWAQTLDGRAAASDGTSRWITGPEARADVHRRRAQADAIVVGTGTLLADDPELTARSTDGSLLVPAARQPLPVVVGRRAIPAGARIRQHPALGDPSGIAEPVHLSGENLLADLQHLGGLGIHRVFVEGGPALASSFVRAGLADSLLVYIAPALLGGPRLALDDIGVQSMDGMVRLRTVRAEQLGDDLLIEATPRRSTELTEGRN